MAPEVFKHGSIDPSIDIFSLGCVLYEMVTGDRLFIGETKEELFNSNKFGHIDESKLDTLGLVGDLIKHMVVSHCRSTLQ